MSYVLILHFVAHTGLPFLRMVCRCGLLGFGARVRCFLSGLSCVKVNKELIDVFSEKQSVCLRLLGGRGSEGRVPQRRDGWLNGHSTALGFDISLYIEGIE